MTNNESNDRRKYPRLRVSVPMEIKTEAGHSPIRGATADLSLSGCYFDTIFPLPVGTKLDLQLFIDTTIVIAAVVITCDLQVGNGIQFIQMLAEDRHALEAFLEATRQAKPESSDIELSEPHVFRR